MFFKDRNKDVDFGFIQKQISNGNEAAFAKLYAIFKKRLVTFSYSLTHSWEIAEDVVADVFVRIWANRQQVASINNLAVYLYVSVKNQSLNRLSEKAKKLVSAPFDDLDVEVQALYNDPHVLMVTSEMMGQMNKAIETLPPRCKMIFKLVREDGLRYKEVADILNISVNTIDAQMAIAIKRICEAVQVRKNQSSNFLKSKIIKNLKKS